MNYKVTKYTFSSVPLEVFVLKHLEQSTWAVSDKTL